jgi:hypothetical protein
VGGWDIADSAGIGTAKLNCALADGVATAEKEGMGVLPVLLSSDALV